MLLGKILVKTISAGIALYLSAIFFNVLIPEIPGDLKTFLIISLTLGLINSIIRPILGIISFPLNLITLGLFGFILNIAIIALLDWYFPELTIQGFWPLIWTTITIFAFDSLSKK